MTESKCSSVWSPHVFVLLVTPLPLVLHFILFMSLWVQFIDIIVILINLKIWM